MEIGCVRTDTQRGVVITGNRSTRARISSNDRLPDPRMIEDRSSIRVSATGPEGATFAYMDSFVDELTAIDEEEAQPEPTAAPEVAPTAIRGSMRLPRSSL